MKITSKTATEFYVYGLFDPRSNIIRYVGYTFNLINRFRGHCKDSNLKENNHKNNWVKSLKKLNLLPAIKILEVYPTIKLAKEAEIKLIKYYNDLGYNLTNSTIGGEGIEYFTEDIIKKLIISGKKNKGKKHTEETKLKLSIASSGRKHSIETLEKMSIIGKNNNANRLNTRLKNGTLKITKEGANEIRRLYAAGEYQQKYFVKKYNVTPSIISAVVNNRIYPDHDYTYVKPKQIKSPFSEEHKKNLGNSRRGKPGRKRFQEEDIKANNSKAKNNTFRNKITLEQCYEIIAIFNDERISLTKLGKRFNTGHHTIRKIIDGTYAVLKYRNNL